MRHIFIVNPAAGKWKVNRETVEGIRALCRETGVDYEIAFTECGGDGARLAASYIQRTEGLLRLYACGGDGTLNEIVQAAAGHGHAAVTNLPLGTGNDFLKIFGPKYRELFSDVPALMEGPQAAFDLIDCNGRLGLDIVCAGVDARVAADVHKYKNIGGMGAYSLALVENVLFKGVARDMVLTVGDKKWAQPLTIVAVCNGRYYGGGFMPVGEAMPDDGVLDTLVVRKVSIPTFARLVGDYSKGRYKKHPKEIKDFHGDFPITLKADQPITAVVDGEVMEAHTFSIKLSEKKVNFFYPEGATWRPEEMTASETDGAPGDFRQNRG